MTRRIFMISLLTVIMLFMGCQTREVASVATLRVAEQYGLAYAPLTIIKEKNLAAPYADSLVLEWKKLGNTAAIREAMVSGHLDVGFMGIPPFLIGKDAGMQWQMITGLSKAPLGLMTLDPEIQSLSDVDAKQRIALPQPGSIQHILLSMAAEKQLGRADYFDNQLVTMKHPDGLQALVAGKDVTLHFTSPPYLFKEVEAGAHYVVSGNEAFGEVFTFIVGTATDDVLEKQPEAIHIFLAVLQDALTFMKDNPEETAELLARAYDMEPQDVAQYLSDPSMEYTTEIDGFETFSSFMHKHGYIDVELQEGDVRWSFTDN